MEIYNQQLVMGHKRWICEYIIDKHINQYLRRIKTVNM
jgi:hypothetical protein